MVMRGGATQDGCHRRVNLSTAEQRHIDRDRGDQPTYWDEHTVGSFYVEAPQLLSPSIALHKTSTKMKFKCNQLTWADGWISVVAMKRFCGTNVYFFGGNANVWAVLGFNLTFSILTLWSDSLSVCFITDCSLHTERYGLNLIRVKILTFNRVKSVSNSGIIIKIQKK